MLHHSEDRGLVSSETEHPVPPGLTLSLPWGGLFESSSWTLGQSILPVLPQGLQVTLAWVLKPRCLL